MKRAVTLSLLFLIACLGGGVAVAGPLSFELLGLQPLANVQSVEWRASDLFLLQDGAVGVVDTRSPGTLLPVEQSATLAADYTSSHRAGNWFYLFNHEGGIAVLQLFEHRVRLVSEVRLDDSVFAIAAAGRYIYLASGFAGIQVVDAADRNSMNTVARIDYGVRYSNLAVSHDLLFAVDDFNGVDIFRVSGPELDYLTTIITDAPVTEMLWRQPHLYTASGDRKLVDHRLDDQFAAVSSVERLFDRPLTGLSGVGGRAVVSFDDGLLGWYDLESAELLDTVYLPFPAKDVAVDTMATPTTVAIADPVGQVRLMQIVADRFAAMAQIDLVARPLDLLAATDRLFTATAAGGIGEYTFGGGRVDRRVAYPTGLVFQSLARYGSLLFAATTGQGQLLAYDLAAEPAVPLAAIATSLPAAFLAVADRGNGRLQIVLAGAEGAESFVFSRESGVFEHDWSLTVPDPISSAFFSDGLLGLATDAGQLHFFYPLAPEESTPVLVGQETIPSNVRAMLLIGEYLLLGTEEALLVKRLLLPMYQLQDIDEWPSLGGVRQLDYDAEGHWLFVACADRCVKYLTFSATEPGGTAYPIPGTEGAVGLEVSGDRIFVMSAAGIAAYRSLPAAMPQPTLPQSFRVSQNYPNPFNNTTRIEIRAAGDGVLSGEIEFQVYNILGQLVRQERYPAASTRMVLDWDGTNGRRQRVSSGLYLIRLQFGDSSVVRKALLLK